MRASWCPVRDQRAGPTIGPMANARPSAVTNEREPGLAQFFSSIAG
jgi:hypothetical protein